VRRIVSGAIYAFSAAIGVLAFVYPFFLDARPTGPLGIAHGQDAPLVTTALVGLSLVALLVELQGQAISAKMVATLGVLVAVTSVLRFIEVAVPMPGGFSPIFAPIILAGYVFGGRFGFLMGAFTLLVSGLITGGVGPWLPYQMFTAGWVGLTAGWLSRITHYVSCFTHHASRITLRVLRTTHHTPFTAQRATRLDILTLSIFAFAWGLLYGVIINIYFWPFAMGPVEQVWRPGIGLGETLARYAAFYVATSLGWDLVRAVGNVALILLLGAPTVRALTRFQRRFHFKTFPVTACPSTEVTPPEVSRSPTRSPNPLTANPLTAIRSIRSPNSLTANPLTAFLWALTALVAASSTRNPLYVILLLLVAMVVGVACAPIKGRRVPLSPLRFAAVAVPLAALFNGLTAHLGDTVLLRLPNWLPLLGGPVTLEALVFGATNGLTLAVIFSGFAIFNQVTPVHDLVRLTPRAFHEAGVVLSIALTFIPQTTRSLSRIREAQAVRGHRVRGLRDWLPIIVPLLVSGLERSMGLAEAMVARGYGAVSDRANPLRTQGPLALGLLALLGGWLAWLLLPLWERAALGGMIAGAGLIIGVLWLAGRAVPRTAYRTRRWTARDTLVVLGCGLTLAVVLLPLPLADRGTLAYAPYPRLTLPAFDPFIGLGLLGLLVPAVVVTGDPAGRVRSLRSERGGWADQNSGQGQECGGA